MTMMGCLRCLLTVMPLLWLAESTRADEGMPALLQFAKKHQESQAAVESAPGKASSPAKNKPVQDKAPARGAEVKKPAATGKPSTASATAVLQKTLKSQAAQLKVQQATIAQLEKQLTEAKLAPPAAQVLDASAPDLKGLSNLAKRVRQALAITLGEQEVLEQMRQLRVREAESVAQLAAVKKDNVGLQAQLRSLARGGEGAEKAYQQALDKQKQLQDTLVGVKQRLGAREITLTDKEKALSAMQQELVSLQKMLHAREAEKVQAVTALAASQQQLDTLTAGQAALRTQLTAQEKALSAQRDEAERARQALDVQLTAERKRGEQLQTDIVALRERARLLASPQTLKTDAGSQAYAAGVSLGRDIQALLDERKGWGIKIDLQTLLNGVIDTFSGQYQLTTDVLDKAMLAAERAAEQAREKTAQRQRLSGEDFLAGFKKQKGVKASPAGFWYRVGHVGDEVIPASAIVDVVVKESLIDGTVIQDMDIGGKVLSQPLPAYPPLFREAIGYLNNHGSVTLVVPPALAYGEAGYPPKIPPQATMVYELRVEGVRVPE